jgi:hypothetical protein
MPCPQDHKHYATQVDAERALAKLVADAKKSGRGGKSYKRLNVFRCGSHWHVGRANKLPVSYQPPASGTKPPSTGDLRRKLERMARTWDRQEDYERRQRADAIGRIIAAEDAIAAAENEYAEACRAAISLLMPELLQQKMSEQRTTNTSTH